jgi:hypothetical protein
LIGNYPQTNDNILAGIDPSTRVALAFTSPTGGNYNLNDIVLRLGNYQSSLDTPLLRIYADSAKTSTDPNGATLQSVTFTNPTSSLSGNIDNFTFTPTSAFTFLADTRYWIDLSNSTTGFGWYGSNPGITPTGISGITFNGTKASMSGGSYQSISFIPTFQINATAAGAATAVPEPTSLPGYITFLGALLAARKIVKFRAAKKVELK